MNAEKWPPAPAMNRVIKEVGSRRSFAKQNTVLRRGDCYGEEVSRRRFYCAISITVVPGR